MYYEKEEARMIEGESLDDCRDQLYKLYGNEYSIVNKRAVIKRTGFLGLRKKPVLVAYYVVKDRGQPSSDFLHRQAESLQRQQEEEIRLQKNKEAILKDNQSVIMNAQIDKMNDLQKQVSSLIDSVGKLANTNSVAQESHESITKIEELLQQNDFSFSYIQMITSKIRSTFSLEQLNDFDLVERTVVDWIGDSISLAVRKTYRPPHVFIIVGPTGVGKTTTLVKLLAMQIKATKGTGVPHEARLITTDVMRVGAEDQLKHFGEIMKKDVLKAENVNDLKELFDENKDHCDAIYIDTSGYSPNDSEHIGRLKAMLDVPGLTPEIFLAFDAKTKFRDILNIMQNYEPFGYSSVIVTKCDESEVYGNVISALYENRKSVAFVTDGQSAARNINKADVVFFLTRLEGFRIDREHINNRFLKNDME